MGIYDAFKDALNVAQKADNVELYRKLLDLSAQALDLQAENARLKEENAELRKIRDLEQSIIRHNQPYISISDDERQLPYCAVCWAKENKLYQMKVLNTYGVAEVYCKYEREWRIVLVIATEQINDRRLPLIAPCPSSISFGYHFLRPFFYYDYKNEIECINASSCIKNVKKLLEHLVKAKIPITVMVPTIGGYQLIPRAISVEALQYLVCKHFRNDKPENMRYYYVVHDQLMDLIEETNHHA